MRVVKRGNNCCCLDGSFANSSRKAKPTWSKNEDKLPLFLLWRSWRRSSSKGIVKSPKTNTWHDSIFLGKRRENAKFLEERGGQD